MASPIIAKELQKAIHASLAEARLRKHEYLTVEHLLYALLEDRRCAEVLEACGAVRSRLHEKLDRFLSEVEKGDGGEPTQTIGVERVLQRAAFHALSSEQK